MSLLADLLSKVKNKSASGMEGRKTDVPPNLKRVISNFAEKEAVKKKIIIFSVLILFAIISGIGGVYLMELYIRKPSAVKKTAERIAPPQIETRPASPPPETDKTETDKKDNAKSADMLDHAKIPEPPKPGAGTDAETDAVLKPKTVNPKPAKKPQPLMEAKQKTEDRSQKIAEEQKPTGKAEAKAKDKPKEIQKPAAAEQKPEPKTHDQQTNVYLYTAKTYESKKDYHQALQNYKKALEIEADNVTIMNNIASVLINLGSFEEAVKYAESALNIRKDYVPSLINLGIAHLRLNNLTEGEMHLSKALSLEPSNSSALFNIGILYEKRGDNERAYGYFYKLSEMGNIQGYLGIARIWEKQGRTSEAARIYREILSMDNVALEIKKLANDRLIQLQ